MHRQPANPWPVIREQMRLEIASNLGIDPDRVRYAKLDHRSKIGITGDQWQIHYRDEWRELPWFYDGPLSVTRDLVRQWHGEAVA